MSTAQQDTEITLGTGRMLALFFTLVLVCAVFFAIGFSLGRRTGAVGIGGTMTASAGTPAAVVRPSPAAKQSTPPQPQSGDFSFYNSVGAKTANTDLTTKPAEPQRAVSTANTAASTIPAVATDVPPATGAYFVQVAAVSRQEDADSLVEALKKKQYPAFTNNTSAGDKFFHVQVGPYSDLKEAEAMKARLVADGYSPIVKK